MHKGPLPGVGGSRKYHEVSQRAVTDMAQYMGPTASVSNILEKHSVIFGTVTSFNVLMQNFYKITQGNNEKVSSFAMRLEGT